MRRAALLLLIAFASLAVGDESPPYRREVARRGTQFPRNFAILVDRSGSMIDKYDVAVREAVRVAEDATDEGRACFFAFGSDVTPDPQGWIKLPDAEALALARGFLLSLQPYGRTDVVSAARDALLLPEPDLGVVIVTDEDPDGGALAAAAQVVALNEVRPSPAVVGVIGVFPRDDLAFGHAVAAACGGGYVRVVPAK